MRRDLIDWPVFTQKVRIVIEKKEIVKWRWNGWYYMYSRGILNKCWHYPVIVNIETYEILFLDDFKHLSGFQIDLRDLNSEYFDLNDFLVHELKSWSFGNNKQKDDDEIIFKKLSTTSITVWFTVSCTWKSHCIMRASWWFLDDFDFHKLHKIRVMKHDWKGISFIRGDHRIPSCLHSPVDQRRTRV